MDQRVKPLVCLCIIYNFQSWEGEWDGGMWNEIYCEEEIAFEYYLFRDEEKVLFNELI